MQADNPHLQQSFPTEYFTFDVDGRTLIARDVPEGVVELYEVMGATRNVRTLASADAVLDALRDSEGYVHETRYTTDILVSVAVDGYGPAAIRVCPVTGPPAEPSFDDYFSHTDASSSSVDVADKTLLHLYPYADGREERLAAAVGYVVELAEHVSSSA